MKTVLVTGGGGFVGNVLCRHLLREGYLVRCMDNFQKGQCDALLGMADNPMFEFMYGDVTNMDDCRKAVEGMDSVVHLAAIVGFPACKRQPSLSEAVNVGGTKNMLEAREDRRFVFASTGSVYGAVEGVCTEDSPLNAQSLYGIHKKEAEDAVSKSHNSVSFRFATGFGLSPCMRVNLLVNDFVYQAMNNGCMTVFQADFSRTFIHVKDMARAFHFGMTTKNKYKVYNCGDNDLNWTKRELAEFVKEHTGCVVNYEEFATDADQRNYSVSVDRIQQEGFKCKYSLEYGIKELIDAMPILQIRHQYE